MFVNAVPTKRSRDISTGSIYIKLLSPDSARHLRIIRDVSVRVDGGTRAHRAQDTIYRLSRRSFPQIIRIRTVGARAVNKRREIVALSPRTSIQIPYRIIIFFCILFAFFNITKKNVHYP